MMTTRDLAMTNRSPTEDWRARINVDPAGHHGQACIAGTRIAVSVIVGSIAEGDSVDDLLRSYPQLKAEDVAAALNFAADAVRGYNVVPLRQAS
jgi:uncharacterized protein (DUF433 family)